MECDTIFNQFQHQPENERGWALLRWAYITVDVLPLMDQEETCLADAPIPPFFNYHELTYAGFAIRNSL